MDGYKNFAYTQVLTAPAPATSGTTVTLPAGHGGLFPVAPFQVTVWPAATVPTVGNAEIMRVTAKVGDTLTVTRAQEGTTARAVLTGDQISATLTAKTMTDLGGRYAADLPSGTNVPVTHSLGTTDVVVAVYVKATGVEVDVPFTRTSANSITLNSAVDLAGHRIVVLG